MSDPQRAEGDSIKSQALSGAKWLAAGKLTGQVINWALTFWVMRILAPADYGLMAMASMFVAVLTLFNEMGMGAAVVQAREVSNRMIRQVFGLTLVVNFFLFGLLFSAAPGIASFFSEPQLLDMIRLLSVQFVVMGFLIVPQALLDRDMAFKKKSLVDLVANLAAGGLSLGLALTGHGVWSLVWASLALVGLRTLGYHLTVRFCLLPLFSLSGMARVLRFGGQITLEKLVWYLYIQADTLIIGKLLGKEILGFYSVGKHVASLPSDKIMPIVNQILFSAFSRIQDDLEKVSQYTLELVLLLSVGAFPVFWGLGAVAPELIEAVLGDKWGDAALPLMLISLALPLRMASGILVSVLKSLGRSDVSLVNQCIYFCIMVPGFLVGSTWGILGVSLVWAVLYPAGFWIVITRSAGLAGVAPMEIFRKMAKPAAFAGIMAGIVWAMGNWFADQSVYVSLASYVISGAAVYCSLQLLFSRSELKSLAALLRA